MCRGKNQRGARRCAPNARSKALAAANRRIGRINTMLADANISDSRREVLETRLQTARSDLHSLKDNAAPETSSLGASHVDTTLGNESTEKLQSYLKTSYSLEDIDMDEVRKALEDFVDEDDDDYDGESEDPRELVETLSEIGFEHFRISGDIDVLDPIASSLKSKVVADLTRRMSDVADEDLLDEDELDQVKNLDLSFAMAQDEREYIRSEAVSRLVSRWAINYSRDSLGNSTGSLDDLQDAAKHLSEAGHPISGGDTSRERVANAFIGAQYEATQEYLSEKGIGQLSIHRGFSWGGHDVEKDVDLSPPQPWAVPSSNFSDAKEVPLSAMSSFTLDEDTAERFATHNDEALMGTVISGTVPANRILSMPNTGMGCFAEQEIIVLGGEGNWAVKSNYGEWDSLDDYVSEFGWKI